LRVGSNKSRDGHRIQLKVKFKPEREREITLPYGKGVLGLFPVREFFPVLFGAFNIHGFRAAMKVAEGLKGAWTLPLRICGG